MTDRSRPPVLTLRELVALVRQLEPRAVEACPFTVRVARYHFTNAGILAPAVRDSASRGDSRLYDHLDLCIARLFVRLRAVRPAWTVTSALVYLGSDIREALARERHVAITMRGARAQLVPAMMPETSGAVVVGLRDIERSSVKAVARLRARAPDIWAGWRWTKATAVADLRPTA